MRFAFGAASIRPMYLGVLMNIGMNFAVCQKRVSLLAESALIVEGMRSLYRLRISTSS
jgi:hypothetical protein